MSGHLKQWLVFALLLGTAVYAIAEDFTLTTYYPSPRGVYQELKTAGDLVVGDITNPPGARLHVVGSGSAPSLRVDKSPIDATSPVVIDQTGNVGIGTAGPLTEKLAVSGGIKLDTALSAAAGTLQWTGTRFQGHNGTLWYDLPRAVRGAVAPPSCTVASGSGFTVTEFASGSGPACRVNFTTPFPTPPLVVASLNVPYLRYLTVANITSSQFEVRIWDDSGLPPLQLLPFTFVVVEQ